MLAILKEEEKKLATALQRSEEKKNSNDETKREWILICALEKFCRSSNNEWWIFSIQMRVLRTLNIVLTSHKTLAICAVRHKVSYTRFFPPFCCGQSNLAENLRAAEEKTTTNAKKNERLDRDTHGGRGREVEKKKTANTEHSHLNICIIIVHNTFYTLLFFVCWSARWLPEMATKPSPNEEIHLCLSFPITIWTRTLERTQHFRSNYHSCDCRCFVLLLLLLQMLHFVCRLKSQLTLLIWSTNTDHRHHSQLFLFLRNHLNNNYSISPVKCDFVDILAWSFCFNLNR